MQIRVVLRYDGKTVGLVREKPENAGLSTVQPILQSFFCSQSTFAYNLPVASTNFVSVNGRCSCRRHNTWNKRRFVGWGGYLDEFNRFWVFAALMAGRLLPVSASKLTECSGRDPGEQSLTSPLHPPAVGQSFFSVWASGLLGNKPRAQGPSRPCCQLGLRGCRAEPCRALQNCCIGIDAISQRLPRTRCSLSSMIINYSELCSLATQGNLYTSPRLLLASHTCQIEHNAHAIAVCLRLLCSCRRDRHG